MNNETLLIASAAIIAAIGALGLSYLVTTGFLALILWLANGIFETSYNPNIWQAGLLLWLVLLLFKGLFSVTINRSE